MNTNKIKEEQRNLAVLANFRIDNEERLQRMKDSFKSFFEYNPIQWVINIRGKLKEEASHYLKSNLKENLELFYLESKKGWNFDTRKLIKYINGNLVMIWVEDHILVNTLTKFDDVLKEMYFRKIDCLHYSFLTDSTINFYNNLEKEYIGKNLNSWRFDKDLNIFCYRNNLSHKYSIPLMSIMRLDFLEKVLSCPRPYLKRFPVSFPFDFEKRISDQVTPSYSIAFPNDELFASIDDDHWNENYSLISRGLYPMRLNRENIRKSEYNSAYFIRFLKKITPNNLLIISQKIYQLILRLIYTFNFFIINIF